MSLTSSLLLGQATFDREVYEEKGRSLPYRILLPKDFEPTKKYPLLVFLHGAGERGSDNALQLTHGSSLFLTPAFREKQPAIIVFPHCPKEDYWATIVSREGPNRFVYSEKPKDNPQLDLVEGMLRSLKKKYRIDKKRIYLGGLSMGAMGPLNWFTAIRESLQLPLPFVVEQTLKSQENFDALFGALTTGKPTKLFP